MPNPSTTDLIIIGGGFVKDDLAHMLAHGGARLIRWLQDEGIRTLMRW